MNQMTKEDFVYSRIGMALVSAQRVEFIAGKILNHLIEFDHDFDGVTSEEFLKKTAESKNGKRTLGTIFHFLKFNPKLVIEEELDRYLKKRNLLAHSFWTTYLGAGMDGKEAADFCYDFGRHSERVESFFKGFLFFLASRYVKDFDSLEPSIKVMRPDFDYFMESLQEKNLK